MLVQSIAQLEEAILKTEQSLEKFQISFGLIDRFSTLQYRLQELKKEKEVLETEKRVFTDNKDFALQLNNKLKENRTLLEEILSHTPYDGDYELIDSFNDSVIGLS
jgi:FtsZ-binding cell division protein ZapB